MKMKKLTKIVTFLLIFATILGSASVVFGSGTINIPTASSVTAAGFNNTVGNILGVITFICYAAAVIMLMILGIKYITASPEGKAEVKKSAVIYVIGAILVFAAGAVLQLIRNIGDTVVVTA